MSRLEIRLFGQIRIDSGGEPLPGLSAKAMELLCYLLLHQERAHAREALAGLFWPDAPDILARKYLRQAIWRLQSVLGSRDVLIVHSGWIRINPRALLWVDVVAFEQAHDIHSDTPGHELTDQQAQAIEAAVVLYHGDLIEAWYQDWCIYERDRLQLVYLAMLEQLMSYCEVRRHYPQGIAYGQRILRYDPARECTHRNLMRLYYHAGDRTTALRQFERCTEAMAKQFSVRPSRETVALYHQVRGDRVEAFAGGEPREHSSGNAGEYRGDLLRGLQTSLDLIAANVSALQRQIQQELAPVSRMQAGLARADVRDIA